MGNDEGTAKRTSVREGTQMTMQTAQLPSGAPQATRQGLRHLIVLVASLSLTVVVMGALSVVVGQWA